MSLSVKQVDQLLKPINTKRVLKHDGQSHVSQQDVRAHLNRIFGFCGWDKKILELRLVRDTTITVPPKNNRPAREVPAVTYVCTLQLIIKDPDGNVVKVSEDVGTGTAPNLPGYGDAHDFAAKNAISYALKRCATDLGDQFGLSLYNKGQVTALVGATLVHPGADEASEASDVEANVPQQVSMGDTEGGDLPAESGSHDAQAVEDGQVEQTPDGLRAKILKTVQVARMSPPVVAEHYQAANGVDLRVETHVEKLADFLDSIEAAEALRGAIRELVQQQRWNIATVQQGYRDEYQRSFLDETDPEPLSVFLANLRMDASRGGETT